MSGNLIIWIPEDLIGPWAWYESPQSQGWAESDDDKAQLSNLGTQSITAIVPGTWVHMFELDLPDMKASERLSAAGFSIEDRLAAPLSQQHLVIGPDTDNRVAVISKARMEILNDELGQAGLTPQAVYAEFDVLPGEAIIEVWGRDVQPGQLGYSIEGLDAPANQDEINPLALMEGMSFEPALNLASGDYAPRSNSLISARQLGRLAASFVVGALAWLLWQGAQGAALDRQAAALKAEAAALYTQATGQAAPDNPARAVTISQKSGKTQKADFLSLSDAFFAGLVNIDAIAVDNLRYDSTQNQLVLRLIYPGFEAASQLEAVFKDRPGNFQSGTVRDQGGQLIGDAVFSLEDGS